MEHKGEQWQALVRRIMMQAEVAGQKGMSRNDGTLSSAKFKSIALVILKLRLGENIS